MVLEILKHYVPSDVVNHIIGDYLKFELPFIQADQRFYATIREIEFRVSRTLYSETLEYERINKKFRAMQTIGETSLDFDIRLNCVWQEFIDLQETQQVFWYELLPSDSILYICKLPRDQHCIIYNSHCYLEHDQRSYELTIRSIDHNQLEKLFKSIYNMTECVLCDQPLDVQFCREQLTLERFCPSCFQT